MNPPEEKHTRPMAQEEHLDRITNGPDRLVSGSGSCSTPGQGTYSGQYPDTESTPGPDSTFERSGSWSGSCRFRARETRVGARDPMYRALGAWSGANRSEDSRPGREVAFPICAGPLGVSARMIRIISTPDRTPGHVRGKRGERPLQQGRSPLIFPCGKAVLEMIRVVRSGSCRSGSRIEQECSGCGSWSERFPGHARTMVRVGTMRVLQVRSAPDPV